MVWSSPPLHSTHVTVNSCGGDVVDRDTLLGLENSEHVPDESIFHRSERKLIFQNLRTTRNAEQESELVGDPNSQEFQESDFGKSEMERTRGFIDTCGRIYAQNLAEGRQGSQSHKESAA